jgi:putative transposase
MSKRRKLTPEEKAQKEEKRSMIRNIIEHYGVKDGKSLEFAIKDLMKDVIEESLEAELDEELGYSKYDYRTKESTNSRNGHTQKTLRSSVGEFEVTLPRDREGEFEPQLVKKHQKDITSIEDRLLSMYAKGMSTRDIQAHMEEIYGIDMSKDMVHRITDKIIPVVKEWQNRPLEEVYAIVYLDGMVFNVRQDGQVVKKTAYSILGFNLEGEKEILGFWIGETESAKFWLNVLNELKNRGVQDILIASIDGLSGFESAISTVFPKTDIQRCIVHQIRNCTKYVPHKDKKYFCSDMSQIYKAPTEEAALLALDRFEEIWGKKYQYAVKSWRTNWPYLSTFFKYPKEIRKLIYTTNPIESYNRSVRKISKTKGSFSCDDALSKILYLVTIDVTKKWTQKHRDWTSIIGQLAIYFEDRLAGYIR